MRVCMRVCMIEENRTHDRHTTGTQDTNGTPPPAKGGIQANTKIKFVIGGRSTRKK